jgi:hypothetical protein
MCCKGEVCLLSTSSLYVVLPPIHLPTPSPGPPIPEWLDLGAAHGDVLPGDQHTVLNQVCHNSPL